MTRSGDEKPCTYQGCDGIMKAGAEIQVGLGPTGHTWQCKKNPSHVEPRGKNQT